MTLFFPDLNVWLALSDGGHGHHTAARNWLAQVRDTDRLILSRYTQIGLLRLLTNQAVMGDQVQSLKAAWEVFDRWLEDPRVDFYPEPRGIDSTFRRITAPFAKFPASKAVGDSWLLAFSVDNHATLVTFDQALIRHAKKIGHEAVSPA